MINFPAITPGFIGPQTDGTPADQQTDRPKPGEQTLPQGPGYYYAAPLAWGDACANGGTSANPCGFPRYGDLYVGSYQTYRWMLEHPIIQHARAQVFDPIIASPWGYESKDDAHDDKLNFVKDQLECLRFEILSDALRALDYGCAPFEKVWKVVGGKYVLDCMKPLRVETTAIVTDQHGGYAGVETTGTAGTERLGVHKSWLYTYDGEFGYLYGRSRLENLRATAWRDWLDAATDLVKLSHKIAGKLGILSTPVGTYKKTDGTTGNWSDVATTVGRMLTSNASLLHIPHMGSSNPVVPGQQNFDQFVALLKASAVNLQMVDFGSNSPAISALLERMRMNEERMFAGYFQSPRTGMATQGGTKADAQQHTDTAVINAENVATSIARSFNRWVVDDILVLNFGEAARGTVWVNPGKLTDANLATDNKILDAILLDPDLRGKYVAQLDVDSITDRRGIPHEEPIVLDEPLPKVPPITGATIKDPNIPPANPADDNLDVAA